MACGAAGEFLEAARTAGCDAMVLGEARFHTCLEAEAWGIGLLLPGHYASERFAIEALADVLGRRFAGRTGLGEPGGTRSVAVDKPPDFPPRSRRRLSSEKNEQ